MKRPFDVRSSSISVEKLREVIRRMIGTKPRKGGFTKDELRRIYVVLAIAKQDRVYPIPIFAKPSGLSRSGHRRDLGVDRSRDDQPSLRNMENTRGYQLEDLDRLLSGGEDSTDKKDKG